LLSPVSGVTGSSTTVSGTGYRPGSTVEIWFGSVLVGTAVADADGRFSQSITIPEVRPGQHDVRALGIGADGDPYEQTASFRVQARPATPAPVVLSSGSGLAAEPQVLGTEAEPTAAAGRSRFALPTTGTDVLLVGGAGLALLAAGAGTAVAARRRKAINP
jgi:LPXTG-motif cell wall-anchored protein